MVTYLGVQYRVQTIDSTIRMVYILSGTVTDGILIRIDRTTSTTSVTDQQVLLETRSGGIVTDSSVIGLFTQVNTAVTSVSGPDVTDVVALPARPVYLSPNTRFIKLNQNGNDPHWTGESTQYGLFDVFFDADATTGKLTITSTQSGSPVAYEFPFTFDEVTQMGTLPTSIAEFIGVLQDVEFVNSGQWVVPDDLDREKPVIFRTWGAGANGETTTLADEGGDGGGGGAMILKNLNIALTPGTILTINIATAGVGDTTAKIASLYSYAEAKSAVGRTGGALSSGMQTTNGGGSGAVGSDLNYGGGGGTSGNLTFTAPGGSTSTGGLDWDTNTGGGGDGATAIRAATNGKFPGGGGGGGYGDGSYTTGGLGAAGYLVISRYVAPIIQSQEPEQPEEGSRKTIAIDTQRNIVGQDVKTVLAETNGTLHILGGSGGVSTAGPKHGQQEIVRINNSNLS